jgi:hypothetical protein
MRSIRFVTDLFKTLESNTEFLEFRDAEMPMDLAAAKLRIGNS